ncbi:MAG: hypothetical protein NVS3B25_09920 [Hymenobacter sp.]
MQADESDPKMAALADLRSFLKDRQKTRLGKLGKPDAAPVDAKESADDMSLPEASDAPKAEGVVKAGDLKGDAAAEPKSEEIDIGADESDPPAADDEGPAADDGAGTAEDGDAKPLDGVHADKSKGDPAKVKEALVMLKHLRRR